MLLNYLSYVTWTKLNTNCALVFNQISGTVMEISGRTAGPVPKATTASTSACLAGSTACTFLRQAIAQPKLPGPLQSERPAGAPGGRPSRSHRGTWFSRQNKKEELESEAVSLIAPNRF
jgi:hypothetical protein